MSCLPLRRATLAVLAILKVVSPAAAELDPQTGYRLVAALMSEARSERREAARTLETARDLSLVPAIVDTLFFTPRARRGETLALLETLTGEERAGYLGWVEYVGGHAELEPKARYLEWKQAMLARIDPEYRKVFYLGAPARIRLEEIVFGGVRLDGIPALENPPRVAAGDGGYLRAGERVFGVRLQGEAVAYPLRFLSWHEMLNDEVGGEPVTLSYCTLCGSGILYSARTTGGGRYRFGTSGLLYRSNKLMYDRGSYTLWSNLTGEPVVGRLARARIRLRMLPMTLTTWEEWRRRNPDTQVLDLEGVRKQVADQTGGRVRFEYRPGLAERMRGDVRFPVWLRSESLEREAEVFALEVNGSFKAYPLERLPSVVNDVLGGEPVVLVAEVGSRAVRAYRRGELRFGRGADGALTDGAGRRWSLREEALVPAGSEPGLEPLPRLPGHVAFWFGWFAFHPTTELYDGAS